MTEVTDIRARERREEEASLWVSRLSRGLDGEESRRLELFLRDRRNREEFLRLSRLWDELNVLSRLSELLPDVEPVRPRRIGPWLPAAASVLVLAGVALLFTGLPLVPRMERAPAEAQALAYQTGIGERSSFRLADGTEVQLNTDSRISVYYSDSDRFVELQHGEAHLQVSKDSARPFTVSAGGSLVQAVGTEFSVEYLDSRQLEVIVVEGVVRVAPTQSAVRAVAAHAPGLLAQGATLEAGSIGRFEDRDQAIVPAPPDEIEARLSWRKGNLVFRGETLAEAIAEISRYTDTEFTFLDEQTREVKVAGLFLADDVEGLLRTLRDNFDISYQRLADREVLLSRR